MRSAVSVVTEQPARVMDRRRLRCLCEFPNFRETVERRSNGQIRKIIAEGRGMMPAFDPALKPGEINDMVRMVRFLSREGREVSWWEKYDTLVAAHCSVPWEAVFGYDEPLEAAAGTAGGQDDSRESTTRISVKCLAVLN